MLSMYVPSSIKGTLICQPSIVSKNPTSAPLKSSFFVKPKAISLHSLAYIDLGARPFRGFQSPHAAAAAAELAPAETVADVSDPELGQESEVGHFHFQELISFLLVFNLFIFFITIYMGI